MLPAFFRETSFTHDASTLASLDVAASSVCRPNENLNGLAKGLDRAAALEAKIAGDSIALALVGVGIGSATTVEWLCARFATASGERIRKGRELRPGRDSGTETSVEFDSYCSKGRRSLLLVEI